MASAADRLRCLIAVGWCAGLGKHGQPAIDGLFQTFSHHVCAASIGFGWLAASQQSSKQGQARGKKAMTGQRAAPWEGKKEDRSVCRAVRCLLASIDLADASIPADDRQFYPFRRERWKKTRISLRSWFGDLKAHSPASPAPLARITPRGRAEAVVCSLHSPSFLPPGARSDRPHTHHL